MLRRFMPAGFRGRLLVAFLALSTLPLIATGFAFFSVLEADVQRETLGKLSFATNAKRSELGQYLTFAARQAQSLSRSNTVRYSIGDFYGFSYAFRQIDPSAARAGTILRRAFGTEDGGESLLPTDGDALLNSALEYSNAHGRFHDDYMAFVEEAEFDNIYLVNADGHVVYSARKDAYLGTDLRAMLRATPLSDVAMEALGPPDDSGVSFRDFQTDDVTGHFAAYLAIRVEFYQRTRGAIVFRLPTTGLDRIVRSQGGSAEELYLLSSRYRVLSAPANGARMPGDSEAVGWIPARADGMSPVSRGLGDQPSLDAWSTIDAFGKSWLIVAEIPASVAFASTGTLRQIVLGVGLLSLLVIVAVVLYLSRSMTAPLEALTTGAEAIAAGDLDRDMPAIDQPSELGRLTASFRRMRDAVREQLLLINQKNAQLEEQVRQIAETNAALEEADRQKDAFLANTSHELRTPLNGMIGISETLSAGAAGDLAPVQRSQLQLITFSARRLSRLVDDLLDLYRIRQGRIRLDLQPVHVASSVRHVLQLSEPLFRGEPVTVRVDIPETTPFILADPVRFEQILHNLLGNAIKYTDEGTIRIVAQADGDMVMVEVEDSGRGISPEDLDRIFQPLEQGDGPANRGSGLGLAIARQLTTLLNGTLVAESSLRRGSRFTVRLPAAEAPADVGPPPGSGYHETVNPREEAPIESLPATGRATILIVDDEPINVQVLRNVLGPQGYVLRAVDNGPEAIRVVEESPPELVILDVMMPGMTGLEVARRLRERYSLVDLPILMLTARGRTRDVIAGFENGANDYVVKPFMKDELLARVATLLEAGRARGRARENLGLRDEVERRIRVEDALRLSQRRMTSLLDSVSAGLVCANPAGIVTYANRAAQALFGVPIAAGATSLSALLPASVVEAIVRACGTDGEVTFDELRFEGDDAAHLVHALELEAEAGGGVAIIIAAADSDEPASGDLVESVRGAIDSVGNALAGALAETGGATRNNDHDREAYPQAILDVMNLSLALWTAATGKSRIDLAERSGIWRVTLDRSSLQTRTLDKYFLKETLPAHPRWRDVVRTAEFVLRETADVAEAPIAGRRRALTERLSSLREMIREGGCVRPLPHAAGAVESRRSATQEA